MQQFQPVWAGPPQQQGFNGAQIIYPAKKPFKKLPKDQEPARPCFEACQNARDAMKATLKWMREWRDVSKECGWTNAEVTLSRMMLQYENRPTADELWEQEQKRREAQGMQ